MEKRSRLDIIYDILTTIMNNKNFIKKTPLQRKVNLSTKRFNEYYLELLQKKFIIEINKNAIYVSLIDRGFNFLKKYSSIKNFLEEFEI
jgi:predicted transcriptional regulator